MYRYLLVHCELDGVSPWLGSEVVHSRLQSLFPRVEVHRRQLPLLCTFFYHKGESGDKLNKKQSQQRSASPVVHFYFPQESEPGQAEQLKSQQTCRQKKIDLTKLKQRKQISS